MLPAMMVFATRVMAAGSPARNETSRPPERWAAELPVTVTLRNDTLARE